MIERITNRDTKALTRLIRHPRRKRPLRLTRLGQRQHPRMSRRRRRQRPLTNRPARHRHNLSCAKLQTRPPRPPHHIELGGVLRAGAQPHPRPLQQAQRPQQPLQQRPLAQRRGRPHPQTQTRRRPMPPHLRPHPPTPLTTNRGRWHQAEQLQPALRLHPPQYLRREAPPQLQLNHQLLPLSRHCKCGQDSPHHCRQPVHR